jgi:hypothetical protein
MGNLGESNRAANNNKTTNAWRIAAMSTYYGMLKQLAKLGLLLMMGASMSACSSTASWKEEVQLLDGRKINIKVVDNLGGYPTIESRERATIDEAVVFTLPDAKREIVWNMGFRDDVSEPNSLNLIRFDVVKGVPYIATYPAGCIAYNKWGRPNPPQVLFKYENDQWKRISLAEFPAELINTQANVIVGRPAASLLKSFYTVEGVNEENSGIDTPGYRTILREALPQVQINNMCEERILYKGYWILPNDHVAREIIDQRKK